MNISFIIPVYNCKDYLSACVDSIRSSGIPDYEILLIDDGSTDGSGVLCEELAARFPKIRVIHQANGGVSAARNRGISESRGEYILFVDADDIITLFTDEVMNYLRVGMDMVLFGMEFRYFHRNQYVRKEKMSVAGKIRGDLRMLPGNFKELFDRNYLSTACNKFIKRSVLMDGDIHFDARLSNYEDLSFTIQALSQCSSYVAIPAVNYIYSVNYDHDRTVDRIAKIYDLLGNTDIIAESFLQLEKAICEAGGADTDVLKACLRNIYFELFSVKMKTTGIEAVNKYCRDFVHDRYVKMCLECVGVESGSQERLYNWIRQGNALTIWLRTRYSMLRHFVARNVKRITGWRLS